MYKSNMPKSPARIQCLFPDKKCSKMNLSGKCAYHPDKAHELCKYNK